MYRFSISHALPWRRLRGVAKPRVAFLSAAIAIGVAGCSPGADEPGTTTADGAAPSDDASVADALVEPILVDRLLGIDGDGAAARNDASTDVQNDAGERDSSSTRDAVDGRSADRDEPADADSGATPSDSAAGDGVIRADTAIIDSGGVSDAKGEDGARPTDGGASPDAAMRCNGYEALCDRRFDEVVFPTTHNAMSNADDGWVSPNQEHGMKRQLEEGIRGMLFDTYDYMGSTYLCHGSCLLGNKLFVDALRDVVTFLQNHPHEVLAFVIEDHTSASATETAASASGLSDFVYVHLAGSVWPTLRTMIASGRRVLVGAENGAPPPAWYHRFYDLAWDTPYTFKSASEFSCQENRGSRQNGLFLLNHWLGNPLPDENLSRTANAHDLLLGRARQCQMESGKLPNFVAVNHYAVGDLFAVVHELNGL